MDVRLYLTKEWAKDEKRRAKCGVPDDTRFQTRHALALEMLSQHRTTLPHSWIAGDDEMGRSSAFRRDLRTLGEQYLLAVPSNTLVRDLDAPPPEYSGRRTASSGSLQACRSLARGIAGECLDDDRCPRWVARSTGREGREDPYPGEDRSASQRSRRDVGGSAGRAKRRNDEARLLSLERRARTSLAEFARVAKAEHRIEECLQRAKSDAGLAQYQVRNWIGWYHHQTLSLLAAWFLTQENLRGKKIHTGSDGPEDPRHYCSAVMPRPRLRIPRLHQTQERSHFTA